MSDPKRYSIFNPQEQENPNGAWVHYYDYARLKAELEMLKASSRGHSTSYLYQQMAEDCVRLKEEVERLEDFNSNLRDFLMQDEKGDLLCYADYARLKAEVDRLKANDSIIIQAQASAGKSVVHYLAEIERLKAEVERLTYVDDFIVITKPSIKQLIEQGAQNTPGRYDEQYLIQVDRECYLKVLKHMAEFWDKSKEGKQP